MKTFLEKAANPMRVGRLKVWGPVFLLLLLYLHSLARTTEPAGTPGWNEEMEVSSS